MNGTDERDLPSIFYAGTSYLGKPVSIGLQGETPTASPSAGASAIPSGAVGAQAPGRADPATGIPGVSSSTLLQALQAFGLAKQAGSLVGKGGGMEGSTPTNLPDLTGTEMVVGPEAAAAAATAPPFAPEAPAFATDTLVSPEVAGQAATAPVEASGQLGASGAEGASAGASGVVGAAAAIPALISLLQLAGVNVPDPLTQIGPGGIARGFKRFTDDPSIEQGIGSWANFATSGIPELTQSIIHALGPPPAMAFPKENLLQLEQAVTSHMPPPLESPPGLSPEVKRWIDAANQERDSILTDYSAASLGKTGLGWDRQSAESWRNIWAATTDNLQDTFAHLQGLYETALQGLAGLPVPSDIPSFGGGWGRSLGREKTLAAFPQLTKPPAKPPDQPMIPPPEFFRGDKKLGDEEKQ